MGCPHVLLTQLSKECSLLLGIISYPFPEGTWYHLASRMPGLSSAFLLSGSRMIAELDTKEWNQDYKGGSVVRALAAFADDPGSVLSPVAGRQLTLAGTPTWGDLVTFVWPLRALPSTHTDTVLVKITIAAETNGMTKSNLGRKGFILPYTTVSLFIIIEGSQARNLEAGAEAKATEECCSLWLALQDLLSWLFFPCLFVCVF